MTLTWTILRRTWELCMIMFAINSLRSTGFTSIFFFYSFTTGPFSFYNFMFASISTSFVRTRWPLRPHTINWTNYKTSFIDLVLTILANYQEKEYLTLKFIELLGQCCSLQFSSVLELPSHFPLYFSVIVFLRVFIFFPPPQLLEQEPSSQLPHTQLTSNK